MKATFENTVDILVKAYLNDTLVHGKCHACAVGNMVAAANGFKFDCENIWIKEDGGTVIAMWDLVFSTYKKHQEIDVSAYSKEAKQQIDSTGYTWQQLSKIEYAFESSDKGMTDEEWMFNGLMAVVDVLAEIHNVDLTVKENAKLLFVKP